MAITTNRGTNIIEYHQDTPLTAVDHSFEVHADSDCYTFAIIASTSANFTVALEANFIETGPWFSLDTSKTINSAGQYIYSYDGKPANRIRVRIASIASGTVSLLAHIGVAYHG
jgi:hypothetical protein